MFDRDDLRAAVAAEVLTAEQAARLERWLVARKTGRDPADGESLRFISNLNDVFITIGLGILVFGVATVIGLNMQAFAFDNPRLGILAVALPLGGLAWGLSEYFCARRRLLLPSMLLSLVFVWAVAVSIGALIAPNPAAADGSALSDPGRFASQIGYIGFIGGAVGALIYYLRFRLPFSTALIAASLTGMFYVWALGQGNAGLLLSGMASLVAGVGCLAAGIWFDSRDPERVTRLSDNAFWLHLIAAPQIIFGLRGVLESGGVDLGSVPGASVLILVLLGVSILAVALNRRALIVSAIITFTVAVGVVMSGLSGGNVGMVLATTALIVGGGIVLLGGGWKTARKAVLSVLPKGGSFARIFPPETT